MTTSWPPAELWVLLPEGILACTALLLLLPGSLRRFDRYSLLVPAALTAVGAAGGALAAATATSAPQLGGAIAADGLSRFWITLILLLGAGCLLASLRLPALRAVRPAEYCALILFSTTGMCLAVRAIHGLTLWLALELAAVAGYVLVAVQRREQAAIEAAIKYFVLGALAGATFAFGLALLYGATGTLQFAALAAALPEVAPPRPGLVLAGVLFSCVGLLFKLAVAPFHGWAPDVYQGAPAPVAGFLAAAAKAMTVAVLLRWTWVALAALTPLWQPILAGLCALSLAWGTLAALTQSNLRRLLAYSTVAHAGYVLLGLVAGGERAAVAVLYYTLAYGFLALGSFVAVAALERRHGDLRVGALAGLARRTPWTAAAFAFLLLGLVGLPPTGGFIGKVYLFAAALEAGWTWLVVLGVLASVVSLAYYGRVIAQMFLRPPDGAAELSESEAVATAAGAPWTLLVLAACALVTLVLGVLPQTWTAWATAVVSSILP